MAPAAPLIIAGLPPKKPVSVPIHTTLAIPYEGPKPAINAKAIDSGTSIKARVMPLKISFLNADGWAL